MPVQLNNIIYVCVASSFNLPEFESCLLHRPKHIVLVVSDNAAVNQGAKRLEKVLRETLDGVNVYQPSNEMGKTFNAQDFESCMHWLENCLKPYLEKLPNYPRACNITGGTKLNTLSLTLAPLSWAWIDYKAIDGELQRLSFDAQNLKLQSTQSLPSATAMQVALLNSNQVKKVANNKLITQKPEATIEQAKKLWQALSEPLLPEGKALLEIFGSRHTGLEAAWQYQQFSPSKGGLSLSAKEFIQEYQFSQAQLAWLQAWQNIDEKAIAVNDSHINLPAAQDKSDFKRWLSGDWLEQLIHYWLQEKLPLDAMQCNLKINPLENEKSSNGERETDIVIHHNGKTTVIEVKADLAPGHTIKDLLQQITSLGERLGRTQKILMIGPQLYEKIGNNIDNITLRCKANNVLLCCNKSQLLACF